MEEDNSEPYQAGLYLLNLIQSPILEIAFKGLLLLSLLFLSAFLLGVEALLETTFSKKQAGNSNGKTPEQLLEIRSSLSIVQFLLRTGAGITLAEICRTVLNISNQHLFYVLLFSFMFFMLVYGNWVAVLMPKNKNFDKSGFVENLLAIISFLLSPLASLLTSVKRLSKKQLRKKGYFQKENRTEKLSEINIAKVAEAFNNTNVKQIMRPRMDITAFEVDLDFHELLSKLNSFGFSRVPIFRDTIDKIEGILYLKDVLPYISREKEFPWQNLLRPSYFVPENKKIEELLREFQEKHVHMALVVDGYGGISGLVTLEDILEEIVGEINDELDEVDLNFIKLDQNSYIFEGKTSLNDFFKITKTENHVFDEVKGESESLGGLLLQMNSNLPKKGDKIYYKNFVFRIDSANNKRIKKIKVEILEAKEVNQDAEN